MTDYGQSTLEWPYKINYGKENNVSSDLLILGGGVAGCHGAISAAKRGAKVVVVEKGAVIRSGSGGAGVDHWSGALTNPCSKITPEEAMESGGPLGKPGYSFGHAHFITFKESYDALLDVEKMGVTFRDEDDEFVGAEFRDDETKIMFAYDYENRHTIRVRQGAEIKPAIYKELKRLGVIIYDRVMATSLLTEEGRPGTRVVGATGVNIRTGEFYTFNAKATLLSTAQPLRIWVFSSELVGSNAAHDDPNCTGDGAAMAWKAGAEFTMMERTMPSSGGFRYPAYGTANAHNTWYPCNIVDAKGKEIPWVDRDGKVLKTLSERFRPAPGQRVFMHGYIADNYDLTGPSLIPDLGERIMQGEFELPFYADLPSMPEHERRALFGLMVGHEGKTRIPIYENYTQAGFDPDKDMLQANVMPPHEAGQYRGWWTGVGPPQWRETAFGGGGGLVVDWDLRTSLEGLYAAGNQTAGYGGHPRAAATGRYAARNMVEYMRMAREPIIDRRQVEEEKTRVYAPIVAKGGMGWKELQAGICRIMQDYCGESKGEETLKMGLTWMGSIRESEISNAFARNPHELARTLECSVRLTVGEMIIHASLARKASSKALDFKRLDYPETDPPEWNKFVTTRLENEEVKVGELPFQYWLLPPNAPTHKENYEQHCCI
jgi:succinate dehydrogenase/fumarate reductase flavoprotein subunit